MLKTLLPLLKKGDTIGLSIGCEADGTAGGAATFRINITPRLFTLDGENGADRKALNTPLTLTGTAEELDSPEFVATLTRFTTSVTTTRNTIDEVEAAHKTAAETKKAKIAPPKGKPETTKTGKNESKPAKTETPEPPSAEEKTEALV